MEARVIAPKTGVDVDGGGGGDNLGGEKKNDGKVKWSTYEVESFLSYRFDKPCCRNDDGHEIDEKHLVELEDF